MQLTLPNRSALSLDRPVIVGILNLTPDSFSDGGTYPDPAAAVEAGRQMLADGARVLDVGGESTRPGATRIDADEQWRRIGPVIHRLVDELHAVVSVDTTLSAVAQRALDAGAAILNDVSAGREDPAMLTLAARSGAPIILMHMLGEPATMQQAPTYTDVVVQVRDFLLGRATAAQEAGVPHDNIVLDPGIGFGKTTDHNLTLLAHLDQLVSCGYPVLLGASRKRFLGEITGLDDPRQRVTATATATAIGALAGVSLFRVHDVGPNAQAAAVAWAVKSAGR